ncbi:MAG: VanZ family protein [Gemmatimonadaceae bacterium]|nr:VanZ family protein [Gemmatimonadaceae bacterium]
MSHPRTTPSAPTPRPRFRRAADFTALRLGRAVLGYLALTTAVITLAPFRFQLTPAHGLTTIWTWSDLVMNVLMFVPFGFVHQLTRPRGAPADWRRVLLLGAGLSAAIETAQLFAPDRFSSLLDVATNTAGALLGALLFARVSRYVESEDTVQSLALELPLMGLVYLLVPLAWLLGLGSEGDERRVLLLLLSIVAGAVLGTVHGAYVAPASGRRATRWLVAFPAAWVLVSVVPGARGAWDIVVAAVGVTLAAATWRDAAMQRAPDISPRRFELPTLRLVFPVFATYLALSSLWPLTDAGFGWRGTLALTPPNVALSQPMVYRALEHLAAFTLVGYMGAEFHGRDSRRMRQVLPRVLVFTVLASALLEGARGFHDAYGASVLLFLLTQVAAVFGAYVYVLQRAHVRALVKRRQLLVELAARPPAPLRRTA